MMTRRRAPWSPAKRRAATVLLFLVAAALGWVVLKGLLEPAPGGGTVRSSSAGRASTATAPSHRSSATHRTPRATRATRATRSGSPSSARNGAWPTCDVAGLPSQARRTADVIRAGGPFPYPRHDGVTFRNAQRLLPLQSAGYYREYTVATPGASTRGARRIITGGDPPTDPPNWYYTADHYESFCRITGR